MVGGPNGHRSNGSEIEGRPDPRLKAGVSDGVRTGCPTGGQTVWPDGVPDGWPDRVARWGARRGQTGATSFFDCHVIFECHVTRLGWQRVILLPTLVNQR
jgi:hypothetical protein